MLKFCNVNKNKSPNKVPIIWFNFKPSILNPNMYNKPTFHLNKKYLQIYKLLKKPKLKQRLKEI